MYKLCTQGKWSKVPEGKSFDVFPHISLLTLDVMLRCTCSYQSNCQTNKYDYCVKKSEKNPQNNIVSFPDFTPEHLGGGAY